MEEFLKVLRKTTLVTLISSVGVLTLLAILSIWDVMPSDVTSKAIYSMLLIAAVAFLFMIMAAAMQRGGSVAKKKLGIGWIIVIILAALFVLPQLLGFLFFGFSRFL